MPRGRVLRLPRPDGRPVGGDARVATGGSTPPTGAVTDDTGDGIGRRRALRGGAAVGIALLGAGFLRPLGLFGDGPAAPPAPPRTLDVAVTGTPTAPATPTPGAPPTPTGGRAPANLVSRSGGRTRTSEAGDAPDGDGTGDAPDGDGTGDAPDGDGTGGGGLPPASTPDAPTTDLVVDAGPVVFADVAPGSSGRVRVAGTVGGAPADLWLAARGVDAGEFRLTEPERAAGDADAAGELAAALRVTLAAGDRTLYEGPLAGLDLVAPVAACATDETVATLDWALPRGTGNAVQTDGARVDLRLGATDCGAPAPFA